MWVATKNCYIFSKIIYSLKNINAALGVNLCRLPLEPGPRKRIKN
jgi:hypothetical protein